jgi:DNA invertase Pin-like site-specific DNA recombinase
VSVSSSSPVVGHVRSAVRDRGRETIDRQRAWPTQRRQATAGSDQIPPATRFYEDDGIFGVSPWHDRPGRRQLMKDADAGEFAVARVVSLDCLLRFRVDLVDIIDRLEALGVQLGADACIPTSPFGLPMPRAMAEAAREERQFPADQDAEQREEK